MCNCLGIIQRYFVVGWGNLLPGRSKSSGPTAVNLKARGGAKGGADIGPKSISSGPKGAADIGPKDIPRSQNGTKNGSQNGAQNGPQNGSKAQPQSGRNRKKKKR